MKSSILTKKEEQRIERRKKERRKLQMINARTTTQLTIGEIEKEDKMKEAWND